MPRPRPNTFRHLESLCESKGIALNRTPRGYELTTPDGGTTATEIHLRDAYDTYRNDPAFRDLPIKVGNPKPSPENPSAKFYANPTPAGAVRLAIADLRSLGYGTPEFFAQLNRAADQLEAK